MLETLLLIPARVGGVPIFGFGLLSGLIVVAALVRAVMAVRGGRSADFFGGEAFYWLIAGGLVALVIPAVMLRNVDGDPVGLAIRGYGVCLLVAVTASIAAAAYRARRFGVDPDIIYGIAPWAFFGGILGARTFFVVQYRDQFIGGSIVETIGRMIDFTSGGLVVYGSFIGGAIGVLIFLVRHRVPILKLGDVIVPCLFVGIFFGRMGCLMHGCCWGGRCEPSATALNFPPGSPVYRDQMLDGSLIGLRFDPATRVVEDVASGSIADRSGIEAGDRLLRLQPDAYGSRVDAPRDVPVESIPMGVIVETDRDTVTIPASRMPPRALPVFPAQVVSSLGGLALFLALNLIPAGRFRDGTVMIAGFVGYAVLRFGMEWIRVDEAGQFGTSLTISQWVSVVVLVGSLIGFAALRYRTPPAVAV